MIAELIKAKTSEWEENIPVADKDDKEDGSLYLLQMTVGKLSF